MLYAYFDRQSNLMSLSASPRHRSFYLLDMIVIVKCNMFVNVTRLIKQKRSNAYPSLFIVLVSGVNVDIIVLGYV